MNSPRNISHAIDTLARKNLGRDWELYATLIEHWREIVGDEYAEKVTPVKISFPHAKPSEGASFHGRRTDGVLTIKIPQGLAMTFSYQTSMIQERIARFFGYPAIAKIAFETYYPTTTPREEPPAADSEALAEMKANLADIEDPELRRTLESLGESILRENRHEN
jgi:hypothetical protein